MKENEEKIIDTCIVRPIGGSLCIQLHKTVYDQYDIGYGDYFDVYESKDGSSIVLRKSKRTLRQ